jgi:tetratricopeptide (TPR) repeat protein
MAEAPTNEELAFFNVAPPSEPVGTEIESVATLVSRSRRSLSGCRFEDARSLLEQAHLQAPSDLQVLDLLGFVSFMRKDHVAGERYCRQALLTKPNHAYAHSGLGMHLARLGQWDSAILAIEQAILHSPRWIEPYRDFAILLGEVGRIEEAKRYLERGRQAIPEATKEFDQIESSFTTARPSL